MRFIPVLAIAGLTSCAGFVKAPSSYDSQRGEGSDSLAVRMLELNPQTLREVARTDTASVPRELLSGTRDSYRIGPFDVLIITVWEHPELTTPLGTFRTDLAAGQLVDADGTFYFPYAGRITVAGLTLPELQKQLIQILSKVLRDPQIDVKMVGYRSQRVFLSGEVKLPGVYPVDDVPLSLPELLHRAGGLLLTGDGSDVQLVRGGRVHHIDYIGLQRRGVSLDSLILRPGDQVRVPSSEDRKAYLLGEIAKPSSVKLVNGRISLVQALADAGGFNVLTANAGAVYVMRARDSVGMDVYKLNAGNALTLAWADQFQLRPKDLVFVDQSGMGKWNRIIAQMLPTAQLLNNVGSTVNNATSTTVNIQNLQED